MKQHRKRSRAVESADSEFLEALYEDESGGRSSHRQAQRKAWQFCRQVQRALNLAFADSDAASGLGSLFVEDVSPAPDCGRLLVHVLVPSQLDVPIALEELRRQTPWLRAEVARAITRKRAPELAFAPALEDGGFDE